MENKVLFRAGIKQHKGSFTGIAVLLFLAALSLGTVLTVSINGSRHIRREMERAGYGDLTAWVADVPDLQALAGSIQELSVIRRTDIQKLIYAAYEANGVKSDSEGQLILWPDEKERYHFFQDNLSGYGQAPLEIAAGEVYVSPSMISIMDLQVGDTVTFSVARGGEKLSLTVAGYYEDPFMGSSMIGRKGFLISETDYRAAAESIAESGIDALARTGAMLHIFADADNPLTISQLNGLLNEGTPLSRYTDSVHSFDTTAGFMGILQDAFCGLFAVFALILLGVVLVVMGHSISGIMEQDNKNLGILKTVGFTGNQLVFVQLSQYGAVFTTGILAGALLSVPLSGMVSRMTLTTTGVRIPSGFPFLVCIMAFGAVYVLLMGYAAFRLRNIRSVTPMKAIRGETVHSRGKTERMPAVKANVLSLHLALRQLVSGRRRYIGVFLAAVFLVFFASLAGRMNSWLGADGQGMMDAFNPADLDLGVQALGDLNLEDAQDLVASYTDITDSYMLAMPSVSVEGTGYTANVITDPERFHISKGRSCTAEDEVVLTESAAADLGVSVGDTVNIRGDMGNREFRVSGIYHCANDMGANIGMNREGYLSIGQEEARLWCRHYFLSDPSVKGEITEALNAAYGGDVHVHENSWPGLYGIIGAMRTLLVFMYGTIALFVLIVTGMTGSRLLLAEQKDLGIYKSIGCSAGMLQRAFSLRFGIVALAGASAGTLLSAGLTDPLVSAVMRLAGISNFSSHPSAGSLLLPGGAVILLFFGCAYLFSGRIKRTGMAVLTAE